MALSISTTLTQMAVLLRTVSGVNAVYSQSDTGNTSIPGALNDLPACVVRYGSSTAYLTNGGQHRHTYLVNVDIYERSADAGEGDANVLPFVDRVIEIFNDNLNLGGRVNSLMFNGATWSDELVFRERVYEGWSLQFEISEVASASPAGGS